MHFKALTLICASFLLQSLINSTSAATLPEDSSAATIYSYFDIGSTDDDASLTIESFKAQLNEITSGSYTVLPLVDLVKAQQNGQTLKRRSIALTFDRIDRNFIKTIVPLLNEAKLPFTFFISAGQLDREDAEVSWDDLRNLSDNPLATVGMTAYTYGHNISWTREKLAADLNQSKSRIREELKTEPKFFAYPYGEYSTIYHDLIDQYGFIAAFGQHSGIASKNSDLLALPRFTMTEDLSDLDRFRMTSDALPFPVRDIEPSSMLLSSNPPFPGFTADSSITQTELKTMTCFASGVGQLNVNLLGKNHVELRFPKGFDDMRGRVNCTLPVKVSDDGLDIRLRWLGFLYAVPDTLITN